MFFFFNDPAHTEIYTLSLHDALPIYFDEPVGVFPFLIQVRVDVPETENHFLMRSEEHTSELQSRFDLVCRLLLEKKKQRATVNNKPKPRCIIPTLSRMTCIYFWSLTV